MKIFMVYDRLNDHWVCKNYGRTQLTDKKNKTTVYNTLAGAKCVRNWLKRRQNKVWDIVNLTWKDIQRDLVIVELNLTDYLQTALNKVKYTLGSILKNDDPQSAKYVVVGTGVASLFLREINTDRLIERTLDEVERHWKLRSGESIDVNRLS